MSYLVQMMSEKQIQTLFLTKKPKMIKYAQMTGGHQQVPGVQLCTPLFPTGDKEVSFLAKCCHSWKGAINCKLFITFSTGSWLSGCSVLKKGGNFGVNYSTG